MSAASCTGSAADSSTASPSRARAASPCFWSISSAIFVSIVCAAMIRHAVTGAPWPPMPEHLIDLWRDLTGLVGID